MYGLGWLIVWALLGVAGGFGIGFAVTRSRSSQAAGRTRELENELASARSELDSYRQQVVAQFSETARKFQSLNDAYTDLHQQLAKSSSILCGDGAGPLLQAPQGHQDLIPAEIRAALGAGADASQSSDTAHDGETTRSRASETSDVSSTRGATPAVSTTADSAGADERAGPEPLATTAASEAAPETKPGASTAADGDQAPEATLTRGP